jgi:hypothetical protein
LSLPFAKIDAGLEQARFPTKRLLPVFCKPLFSVLSGALLKNQINNIDEAIVDFLSSAHRSNLEDSER